MKIHSVFDPEFARYGRVMSGYDLEPLLATLEAVSPMPETGTAYVAEQPELMALPVAKALSDRAFGGLPVELGWCNGRNTKLNCLEYHRSSELNLGTEDFILLLGRREDMTDGYLDTATVAAFRVPAGTLIELYASTLHFAPCSAAPGRGFKVLVVLPRGTNLAKPEIVPQNDEDAFSGRATSGSWPMPRAPRLRAARRCACAGRIWISPPTFASNREPASARPSVPEARAFCRPAAVRRAAAAGPYSHKM